MYLGSQFSAIFGIFGSDFSIFLAGLNEPFFKSKRRKQADWIIGRDSSQAYIFKDAM